MSEHPGVVPAVTAGVVKSGYDHYYRYGKWEGRTFPLRRRLLGPLLLAIVLTAEALVRRIAALLDPFELWPRLRDHSHRLVLTSGPEAMSKYRAGPWQARLLPWQRTRWVMVEILAESQGSTAEWIFQPTDGEAAPLGDAFALECASLRWTKRVLRLPDGTRKLVLRRPMDPPPSRPLRFRIKPLTSSRVRRILHRRVNRSGGQPSRASLTGLWEAYEATFPLASRPSYAQWLERVEAPRLEVIDAEAPARLGSLSPRPLVSVLLPTYNTGLKELRECIDSVRAQSYPHWELCIVDDASTLPEVVSTLREYESQDERIRLKVRNVNGHISRASQDALDMATGEFVALLDHDDVLCRHALLLMVEATAQHPAARVFYSDEDKLDETGRRCSPHFKTEFDPDRLLGHNYIAHFLLAQREHVLSSGGFRTGFEGSQDHDLVLRLTHARQPGEVVHVPWVLYHWRESPGSTALQGEAKPYALEAGLRAVKSALEKQRRPASATIDTRGRCYRVTWGLPTPAPRVSIIVPTRDGVELLSQCISSMLELTDYPDFEILIVDNGSRLEKTQRYFEDIADDPRVRVLAYPHPFNFSAINNFAVKHATGTILALVNNDIEVTDGSWLREMVSHTLRPGVGCVGAKLLYPDGRIQHAGVVLGIGGVAGHAFKYQPGNSLGHYSKLCMAHSVSAVTAACLVVSKKIYDEVGGLDEDGLRVAFNDVDFCIKVRDAGHRNVMVPYVALTHHESATRGSDNDESRRERFAGEQRVMHQRYGDALKKDPFYSPHLTLEHEDFELRFRY